MKSIRRFLKSVWLCLLDARVTHASAGASYYVLFMIFPFLISLCLLTTKLNYSEAMVEKFQQIVPAQMQDGIIAYFHYAEEHLSSGFIVTGLLFSLYFCFNAVSFATTTLESFFAPAEKRSFAGRMLSRMGAALVLVLVSPILFLTIVLGRNIMLSLRHIFLIPMWVVALWSYLRIPVAALIMLTVISLAYRFASHGSDLSRRERHGCAALCFTLWLIITLSFSYYLENIGDYSLLYGALGTVIALLLWLYLTAYSFFFSALVVITFKKN